MSYLLNSIDSNQSVSVMIGSIAKYSGRRLTVDKLLIHPKYDSIQRINLDKQMNALKQVIIDSELNDRQRTKEFDDKYNEYNTVFYSYHGHVTISRYFDIALVKVKNRIIPVFNDSHYIVNSICLPKSQIINERNETLVIEGMGVTDPSGSTTNRLKKGITIMRPTYDECNHTVIMKYLLTRNITRFICVLRLNRLSKTLFNPINCGGDSGSPQHQPIGCQAVQIGLSSFGDKTTCGNLSGLVRVSQHIPWIRSEIMKEKIQNFLRFNNRELRVS